METPDCANVHPLGAVTIKFPFFKLCFPVSAIIILPKVVKEVEIALAALSAEILVPPVAGVTVCPQAIPPTNKLVANKSVMGSARRELRRTLKDTLFIPLYPTLPCSWKDNVVKESFLESLVFIKQLVKKLIIWSRNVFIVLWFYMERKLLFINNLNQLKNV